MRRVYRKGKFAVAVFQTGEGILNPGILGDEDALVTIDSGEGRMYIDFAPRHEGRLDLVAVCAALSAREPSPDEVNNWEVEGLSIVSPYDSGLDPKQVANTVLDHLLPPTPSPSFRIEDARAEFPGIPWDDIDLSVQEVVYLLNKVGCTTTVSCSGVSEEHGPEGPGNEPGIGFYFSGSTRELWGLLKVLQDEELQENLSSCGVQLRGVYIHPQGTPEHPYFWCSFGLVDSAHQDERDVRLKLAWANLAALLRKGNDERAGTAPRATQNRL